MIRIVHRASWLAIAIAGVALVAGAQGPPPPGGFGRGASVMTGMGLDGPALMDGSFEFGGLMAGFGGKTVTGKPFQANFTITRTEMLPGNTITNTTTGIVARDTDGSTYRDVKLPAIGPLAASGTSPEFVYIRNVTKMMQYLENIRRKTFEAFAIREHGRPSAPGNKDGKGPKGPGAPEEAVTNTASTYKDPATGTVYNVDDRKTTRTIPAGRIGNQYDIVITTERMFSADLNLVLMESHNDPRFGNSTYQLSGIVLSPSVSFLPDPSFQQAQGHGKMGFGGPGKGRRMPPPPPAPQD